MIRSAKNSTRPLAMLRRAFGSQLWLVKRIGSADFEKSMARRRLNSTIMMRSWRVARMRASSTLIDSPRISPILVAAGMPSAANTPWPSIAPPRCAVWIPGSLPHSVSAAGNVEVYVLLVEPDAAPALPGQCCTLSISPLLERLLLYVTRMPVLYDVDGADGRIATVLLDQLSVAPVEKLNFPMPVDAKLRKIAAAMMADPSDRVTLDDWGRRMAVAPRTLTRALKRETGMSFGRWRQQLHILIALQRLDQGASVHSVALDLGYEGASAFVTMFRKALGKPPARYLAERRIPG